MASKALAPVIESSETKGVKVDAALIAKPFREEIKAKVKELKLMGIGELRHKFNGFSCTRVLIVHLIRSFNRNRRSPLGGTLGEQGSRGQTVCRVDRKGLSGRRLALRFTHH